MVTVASFGFTSTGFRLVYPTYDFYLAPFLGPLYFYREQMLDELTQYLPLWSKKDETWNENSRQWDKRRSRKRKRSWSKKLGRVFLAWKRTLKKKKLLKIVERCSPTGECECGYLNLVSFPNASTFFFFFSHYWISF